MPPRVYDSRIVSLVINDFNAHIMLPNNHYRLSLLINSPSSSDLALCTETTGLGQWASLTLPGTFSYTYRDLGPLLRQQVVVFIGIKPATINITEVFYIPQSG